MTIIGTYITPVCQDRLQTELCFVEGLGEIDSYLFGKITSLCIEKPGFWIEVFSAPTTASEKLCQLYFGLPEKLLFIVDTVACKVTSIFDVAYKIG